MKKITNLEPQKRNKNRMNVYIDGEFAFGLDINTVIFCGLSVGMELEDSSIENVLKEEERNRAYNYALNLLSYRQRTEKEILHKLQEKGYEEDIIEKVFEKLRYYGYINDDHFVKNYIKDKTSLNSWGKKKIQYELMKKGVSKEVFENMWEENVDEHEEFESALKIAQKKWSNIKHADMRKRKEQLMAFLLRRGFSYELIKKIIKELESSV